MSETFFTKQRNANVREIVIKFKLFNKYSFVLKIVTKQVFINEKNDYQNKGSSK